MLIANTSTLLIDQLTWPLFALVARNITHPASQNQWFSILILAHHHFSGIQRQTTALYPLDQANVLLKILLYMNCESVRRSGDADLHIRTKGHHLGWTVAVNLLLNLTCPSICAKILSRIVPKVIWRSFPFLYLKDLFCETCIFVLVGHFLDL